MGDDPKNRGRKHIDNKKKYNSHRKPFSAPKPPTAVTAPAKAKSVARLESNWDRYEQEADADDGTLSLSTNFSLLAAAPIGHGAHFQFKQDKSYLLDDNIKDSHIFNLDLQLLSRGLSTISYYERNGIPESYFTDKEKVIIGAKTKENLEIYNNFLSTSDRPVKNIIFEPQSKSKKDEPKSVEAELKPVSLSAPNKKLDLEEWLDDILED